MTLAVAEALSPNKLNLLYTFFYNIIMLLLCNIHTYYTWLNIL